MEDDLERFRRQFEQERKEAEEKRALHRGEKEREVAYNAAWGAVCRELNRLEANPELPANFDPLEELVGQLKAWQRIQGLVEMAKKFRDQLTRGLDTPERSRRAELWFVNVLIYLAESPPDREKASQLLGEMRQRGFCPFGIAKIASNVKDQVCDHLTGMEVNRRQREAEILERESQPENGPRRSEGEKSNAGEATSPDQNVTPAKDTEPAKRIDVRHGNQTIPDPSHSSAHEPVQLTPFNGGMMVFLQNRVELCGVKLCSDGRPKWMQEVLKVLRERRADGSFVSFGGGELAALIGVEKKDVARVIRDLRDSITESLRSANIKCGRRDVILSGGPDYRIAASLTVQDSVRCQGEPITDIADTAEDSDVRDVLDVRDEAAGVRRAWILQQLADGKRLKATAVVDQFECSKKTALRDFAALKDAGKIKFVGDARTGYYRQCQVRDASQ